MKQTSRKDKQNVFFHVTVSGTSLYLLPVCSLLTKASLWQGRPCTECLREKPGQHVTILHQASTHTETHKTEVLSHLVKQLISFHSYEKVHSLLREEMCLLTGLCLPTL